MSRKNIRVDIPKGSPLGMLNLSEAITKKHESYDPADSPVKHLDMAKFKTDTASARTLHDLSETKHAEGEGFTQDAYTIMGIAEGQTISTDGTIYFTLDIIKGTLFDHFINHEEQASQYGFNVVVSEKKGHRTVRAEIPVNSPQLFIKLCEDITKKYESFGGSTSPLDAIDMSSFKTKTISAKTKLMSAADKHAEGQGHTQDALTIIGTAKGQKITTEGSLYFIMGRVKNKLLDVFKNHEEQIEQWGFNVVITETIKQSKTKRVTVIVAKNSFITIADVVNHSTGKNIGVTNLEYCSGTDPCEPEEANVLNPGETAEINTPDGNVFIKNRSSKRAGRMRLSVKK